MAGDFADRLAAVDDALVDESSEDDGASGQASGEAGDGAPSDAEVAALADRVAELEAAVQALRGYAGSVRAVNDRVEERADAAVATAEDCRERVAALEREVDGSTGVGGRGGRGSRAGASGDRGSRARASGDRPAVVEGERGGSPGRRDGRAVDGDGSRVGDGNAGGAGGESGGDVPWPPSSPRAPYGEPDADDDPEQPGLVARLRDAL
ncbi:DUF7310 family coiled-coil domain-containing protein [Halorubellus salinus]|uniref:DUF7310 family coiled-coil domain-containing protein n=1 Tax=Halorubellus salinus TaxID=755309 RepID=UPI001D097BA0|nr:hypothetical protein [Halorubellus salinus]